MKKIFEKDYYIFSIYAIGLINWFFKLNYLYLILILGLSFFIILKNYDRKHLISLILCTPFVHYNDYYNIVYLIAGLILICLYTYDIYKNDRLLINEIIVAMLILLVLMTFSLFYTLDFNLSFYGVLKFGIYAFVLVYLNSVKTDKIMTIVNSVMYLGVLVILEIGLFFLENYQTNFLDNIKVLDLGWGGYDLISLTFIISFIVTTIGYLKTYKYKYFLFILGFISLSILTLTKGSYISILIISVPYALLLYNKNEKNTYLVKQFVFYVIIALAFRLLVSNPTGITDYWFERIERDNFLDDKYLLIKKGLEVIKINPIFGLGANVSSLFISNYEYIFDSKYFPNFVIQTIATIGILGIIALLYFIFVVIKSLISKNIYNTFVLLMFIVILIQGLFDASFYTGIVMIILSIILSGIERKETAVAE